MVESLEVRALREYVLDARLPHRVTSTVRRGTTSRHGALGTQGEGLAVDFAGPTPDADGSPEMASIAHAFLKVQSQLFELIYTPLGYSIKRGRRVAPYAIESHRDHVHVAVDRGVLVEYPEVAVPDDPNTPNITDIKFFIPVVDQAGFCWGYYLVSSTGEIHAHGDPARVKYHGRSEVVTP